MKKRAFSWASWQGMGGEKCKALTAVGQGMIARISGRFKLFAFIPGWVQYRPGTIMYIMQGRQTLKFSIFTIPT